MIKYLLIEDNDQDIQSFRDTVERMNYEINKEDDKHELATKKEFSREDFDKEINGYEGIIVDIKLSNGNDGSDIIGWIKSNYRVPVVIFTGTPEIEDLKSLQVPIYIKGKAEQEDIIKYLDSIIGTGMFKVLGGRGEIERILRKIFWDNIYQQLDIWIEKSNNNKETERILLRYVISHIQETVSNSVLYETEEMYISPPLTDNLETGSLVQRKDDDMFCIVLSPPCDLAVRDSTFKTDRILTCEIENHDDILCQELQDIKAKNKKENRIKEIIKNNRKNYYHWLPSNKLFEGGFINFRRIETYSQEEFSKLFSKPIVKVQNDFVKNILNRFSVFYSRQGQPDFDFDELSRILHDARKEDTEENK
ncbi:hypothetical protein HMPREF9156_00285 [Scardovia wiggsiae F0424]|uniref:Response regulatory domain-containing protein n=1 Tax=Scardovia wiggsiae F0424 TaxID=857290 RepID=J0X299_9BIFI|nr:response regulator [Scardovia wiggsiae]EJD65521.1 hypothetical protein HMPREF9156_00285 [Scardovia wiggsiae F0424]